MFVTALTVGACDADAAQSAKTRPLLTTAHFTFYSDFATNLNQTLIADFVARRDGRAGAFDAQKDKTCFDRLPSTAREGWARAVEYYRTNQASQGQRVLLRLELAGLVDRALLTDPQDLTTLDAFARARDEAGPAYRQCKWSAQNAANRAWVDRLQPLLRKHSSALGEQLPKLFQTPWRGLPFRVDVVDQVGFSGGNSASDDSGRMHILVSSTNPDNQGLSALEVVFHEACHFLAQPGGPLSNALNTAAKTAGVTLPPDVLHQVHFFIAGEAVRRSFERAGQPYTPYLYSLKLFSDGFREAARRIWPAYMDGTRTLDQAAAELVAAFKS
ncbi:MAG TPA: hypothetical protein VKB50_10385 [Vicinamibacterales bacterium]|nr:hypothetical protein [Vicinamibacterales bacterium]